MPHHASHAAALALLTLAACAADDASPSPTPAAPASPTPTATAAATPIPTAAPTPTAPGGMGTSIVYGAPSTSDAPEVASIPASGLVGAVGVLGEVYVGSAEGLLRLEGGGLVDVPVYDEGDGPQTGAVTALAPRGDGVIVAAAEGIFHTYSWALLRSPLSDQVAGLHIDALASVGEGEGESLWMATSAGLYFAGPTGLYRLDLPGVSGAPRHVVATEERVVAAFSDRVVDLETEGLSFKTLEVSGVNGAAMSSTGVAWLATDSGAYTSAVRGSWTRYPLSDGDAGEPATAVALDLDGAALVATAGGLARLSADGVQGLGQVPGVVHAIARDAIGDLWCQGPDGLQGLRVGHPLSFADSVAPVFAARCHSCHLEGAYAPKHDFSRFEEVEPMLDDLLARVLSGQMPPDGPLTDEQYEAVLLWSQTGSNP